VTGAGWFFLFSLSRAPASLFTYPAVCSLSPASRDGAGLRGCRGRYSGCFQAQEYAGDAGVTRAGAGDGAAGAVRYG
jgi:hypothetical protein